VTTPLFWELVVERDSNFALPSVSNMTPRLLCLNAISVRAQVNIEDAAAADRMFGMLMGDSVAPRKDFIMQNAEQMKLADLDY
jgi:hypothetical protein